MDLVKWVGYLPFFMGYASDFVRKEMEQHVLHPYL
tara:strand:- start:73 stop:177 length:105 start_codon:yes stop_codon:yes gene_type:complete